MNKIERVLRHDGIVAVLDMTATSASAQAAQSPAPMTPPASTPPTSMTAPTSMAPTQPATPAAQGFATPPTSPTPAMGTAPAVQAPVAAPAPAAPAPAAPAGVSWVGDDNWRPIVMEAVKLRQIANEPSVRVLVGEHAVLVSGDDRHVVGVVFIKGHPVVKSVVRMVRQLLRQPSPPPQGL